MDERDDPWYRCAVEILEYMDIDGYETEVAATIQKYFPVHVVRGGKALPLELPAEIEECEASQ